MTTTGMMHDKNLEKQIEKQMGCMTGFLQLFDRQQILSGKRLYTTKRLPPSPAVDSPSESEKTVASPAISKDLEKQQHTRSVPVPSPDRLKKSPMPEPRSPVPEPITPAESPAKSSLPLPVFGFKEGGTKSSWKFRETPRLSLDSRATVDAKGSLYPREIRTNAAILSANRSDNFGDGEGNDDSDKHRRSPSVIARLMGLEQLPHSCPEPVKKAELRRSASESRVSKDLPYRYVDTNNIQQKQVQSNYGNNFPTRFDSQNEEKKKTNFKQVDQMEYNVRIAKSAPPKAAQRGSMSSSPRKLHQQKKSFFDSADFFPEPKQSVSIYGEIEKRLKMRGINEPSKDLETLKQILDALQLKGLLHNSKVTREEINQRNFVYDPNFAYDDSPIVVMRSSRSPVRQGRTGNDSPPSSGFRSRPSPRRNLNNSGETLPAASPKRGRPEIDRNIRNNSNNVRVRASSSPTRSETSSVRSTNSVVRRKNLNVEVEKKGNDLVEQRRVSPVHSPKLNFKRSGSAQTRSPRNLKSTPQISPKEKASLPVEDESSSISESSISTSSQTDTEKTKVEYKEGRSLLERCDKLLHSIAEITSSELQPSPVSVLDSSFYKDESSSPSPVMKRSIDFKDQLVDLEDELWNLAISSGQTEPEEYSDDCDFVYISEILRASNYFPEDSDVFLLLEKQQHLKGNDTSKVSTLHRRLIFDTITEILNRDRQLPPWKLISSGGTPSLRQIWLEFKKIREREEGGDLFEVICGVLRKDLAGDEINGWGDCHVETSESVLDIERLIFKDLVGETIRDLAAFAAKSRGLVQVPRRKLVFG